MIDMFRKIPWQLFSLDGYLLPFQGSHFVKNKTPSISNKNIIAQFIKSSMTLHITF